MRRVLAETREPPGLNAVATKSEVSSRIKKGESVVRRFENGETAPNYDDLDAFIGAYAEATGVSVFDLWDKAIQEAREAEKKLKRGIGPAKEMKPTQAQRQAELNAEKHEAELESELAAESRRSRPSANRSSKSKRGQGSR